MTRTKKLTLQVNGKDLYLLSEAARIVGVSRVALWNAIRKGLLKTVERHIGHVFVDLDEVREWREKHYNERRAEAQRRRWRREKRLRNKTRKVTK